MREEILGVFFKRNLIFILALGTGLTAVTLAGWFLAIPWGEGRGDRPCPVPNGFREIAWLAPPSSSLGWQRLVAAAQFGFSKGTFPECSLEISNAFPSDPAKTPEFLIRWKSKTLVWRWYRADEELAITEKLLERNPPPIAMVGGTSTDNAKQLAERLAMAACSHSMGKPVLMLTTATADDISYTETPAPMRRKLLKIHEGLTFRAGFSNNYMAHILINFLKSQSVWTGSLPAPWIMKWEDDPYATDLMEAFRNSWKNLPDHQGSSAELPNPISIKSSVGGLARPNVDESSAATLFTERASKFTNLENNWLVLCGQILPSRRLLKVMSRENGSRMRGLTVVSGDTLGFNTIYRDWQELWPSIDLPYRLVFFCHQNPVDTAAGFEADPSAAMRHLATGTEDLLLDRDVIHSLIEGWKFIADTDGPVELASCLKKLKYIPTGPTLATAIDNLPNFFDYEGNRMPATGEHLVTLSPPSINKQPNGPGQIEVWSVPGNATSSRFTRIKQLSQPVYRQ